MVTQIRIYKIRPGRMDAWLAGWDASIVPLRERSGFEVVGAWVHRDSNRFIWALSLPASEDWDARGTAYYESEERRALRPDPAECIETQEALIAEGVTPP